jgi:adenylosuccinate synthase
MTTIPKQTVIGDRHRPIIIVQGGQWGSEGKGMVASELARIKQVDVAVRTGTVNAGHTVIVNGMPQRMQQLPTTFTSKDCLLVLGAGAYIHPEILEREIFLINQLMNEDVRERLYVDFRCGLHLPQHTKRAKAADRHTKMGATGKGCSEAVVEKISGRGTTGRTFKQYLADLAQEDAVPALLKDIKFADTASLLNYHYDHASQILIEGTQGTFLDLHLGPYPYTTHKQTQVANWMAECGLSPALKTEIALVCRTFPIRVAGNSGPMPHEISWSKLTAQINKRLRGFGLPAMVGDEALQQFYAAMREVAGEYGQSLFPEQIQDPDHRAEPSVARYLSEAHAEALNRCPEWAVRDLMELWELTTVTKKLRRIAEWDEAMMLESVVLNRPSYVALTFVNYHFPELWGQSFLPGRDHPLYDYLAKTEAQLGVPIDYITLGPERLVPVSQMRESSGKAYNATAGR